MGAVTESILAKKKKKNPFYFPCKMNCYDY